MTFLSFNYFLLLSTTFIAYYTANNNYKYWIIFFASIIFISSISVNALLFTILFSILNYFGGLLLYKHKGNSKLRKIIFWAFIGTDIGILAFYKYINFIFENINSFLNVFQTSSRIDLINLILPIGISYYTFQSIGYLIRINRGIEMPEKNLIMFSNFLLFFPKFLAGPIERSNNFLPQIKNPQSFNPSAISAGLRLILLGAFKKIVIADNLSATVTSIYDNVHSYIGTPLVAVIVVQLIYIYCDFSGYTDMALGSARLFGINLTDNFNRPFLATSVTQFWKRWHISLSSWCNDFIFLPFIVRYRKLGNIAAILGIFLTFIVIGIWHGANWTFVVLGLLQGTAIVYEYFTKRFRIRQASLVPVWISNFVSRILVLAFMGISMVFFFSNSISDAGYVLGHALENLEFNFSGYALIPNKTNFYIAICSFSVLFGFEILQEKGFDIYTRFNNQPQWIRWSIYYIMIAFMYLYNSEVTSFVYLGF